MNMDRYELLERIQSGLQKAAVDARAEVQVAQALEEGMAFEDIVAGCDRFFCREYSRDLLSASIREDAAKRFFIQLQLSRSGITDQLPEGLFFQPGDARPRTYGAAAMAEECREGRKKASAIRRFFLPFENDFFWQRVQLEREEARLLEGLESDILTEYFTQFWELPGQIPASLMLPLILLLPAAHRVAGNAALTAQCLRLLLDEEVQVEKTYACAAEVPSALCMGLGTQRLGVDFACGSSFDDDEPVFRVRLGPLRNSGVHDYLEGGERFELLRTFYSFFMPAGMEVVTSIEVAAEKRKMSLHAEEGAVLGISTVL